jgi:broad specificity phosphatase PhoE
MSSDRAPGGATSLLLIRHGESAANVAATAAEANGAEIIDMPIRDADVPLTMVGADQAEAIALRLSALPVEEYPRSVWVSPYLRAGETASIALAGRPAGTRIRQDERLRDRELGILDLLTTHGVEQRMPTEAARRRRLGKFYYRPPGGESWADVALRIRSFLEVLDTDDCDPHALVVAHDAVVLLFRVVCEGLTELDALHLAHTQPLLNGSLTRLVRADRAAPWRVEFFNDVSHLRQAGARVTAHTTAVDNALPD